MPEPPSNTGTGKILLLACIVAVLVLPGSHVAAFPKPLGQPTETVSDNCRHSDQVYTEDAIVMLTPKAPTHLRLMSGRYVAIVQAMRGYQCTGTVTVRFDGHGYLQTGGDDDPGMIELIPTLSRLSGMAIASTYDAAIVAVIGFGLLVGYAGLWKLNPGASSRWLGAAAFVLLGLAEAAVADVYVFQVSPLVAGIPWLFYFAVTRKYFLLTLGAVLLSFCCSWCSLVRSGTTVICMTFLIATFILRYRDQRPLFPLALIALACVPSILFQQSLIARRNVALARMGATATAQDRHPLWHTAYTGMGFISNSEVPEFKDKFALAKARSIDPTVAYASSQYEAILRNAVWSIFKRKPLIVIENLAAKGGIVTLLGMVLLFPARKFIFGEREVLWFDIAFFFTAAISAINVLLAVPRPRYLLTFSCLSVLYSSIKACRAQPRQLIE